MRRRVLGFCLRGSLGAPPAVARQLWRLTGCAWDEEQAGMPMSQGGIRDWPAGASGLRSDGHLGR